MVNVVIFGPWPQELDREFQMPQVPRKGETIVAPLLTASPPQVKVDDVHWFTDSDGRWLAALWVF